MTFRSALPPDLPRLLDLQNEFYSGEGYPFDFMTKERAMRELMESPALGRIAMIQWDDSIVGFLALTFGFSLEFGGRDAFVDELYVTGRARGKGLGTAALQEAEQICRREGIHALHLEVEFENIPARELYARIGYKEHSRFLMTRRIEWSPAG